VKDEKGVMCILTPRGYGKTYYELEKLSKENQQLKSTLEEIREYINSNCDFNGTALYDKWVAGKVILQIIDKGVNNE
jgi:hypothetical protein